MGEWRIDVTQGFQKYQGSLDCLGSLSAQEFFRWTGQCRAGQAVGQALEIGSDGGPREPP